MWDLLRRRGRRYWRGIGRRTSQSGYARQLPLKGEPTCEGGGDSDEALKL